MADLGTKIGAKWLKNIATAHSMKGRLESVIQKFRMQTCYPGQFGPRPASLAYSWGPGLDSAVWSCTVGPDTPAEKDILNCKGAFGSGGHA